MDTKQQPTAAQLAYEYAIVEEKNAKARKNLQGYTAEHFRKLIREEASKNSK